MHVHWLRQVRHRWEQGYGVCEGCRPLGMGVGGHQCPQYQQADQLRLMCGLKTIYAGLECGQRHLGTCTDIVVAQRPLIELLGGPHQQRLQELHEELILVLP